MSTNIFAFPSGKRTDMARTVDIKGFKATNNAALKRSAKQLRTRLAERSKSSRKIKVRFSSEKEALVVARRIGTLLARHKRQTGEPFEATLAQISIGKTNRKRYALLDGEVPPNGLTLKVDKYVELIDHLSKGIDEDADLLVGTVIAGTSIATDESIDFDALDLVSLTESMVTFLSDRHRLTDYFDEVAKIRARFDLNRNLVEASQSALRERGIENSAYHYEECPPLPGVPVCAVVEARYQTRARIKPCEKSLIDSPDLRSSSISGGALERVKPVNAELVIGRRFFLSIGETMDKGIIGPLFEGRAVIQLKAGQMTLNSRTADDVESAIYGGLCALTDDEGWFICDFEVPEERDDGWKMPPMNPKRPFLPVEMYFHSYLAFDPWNVRQILGNEANEVLSAEILNYEGDWVRPTRFMTMVGVAFETQLHSGTLEKALSSEIERLTIQLEKLKSDRQNLLEVRDQQTLKRWMTASDEAEQ